MKTYNIEVEDFHTYFVSSLGIWVHNMCAKAKERKRPKRGKYEYNGKAQIPNHTQI
ncbi:MAG: hypothetical protein IJ194_01170 [Bacilli bacterium]|nr:hypothetical protein [Bacilli bacterium]